MEESKDIAVAPWTEEQVRNLKAYQECGYMHEFTCMGMHCNRSEREDRGALIPTRLGWTCPCGLYKQYWAHTFMTEPLRENPLSDLITGLTYNTKPGDYLVINIDGMIGGYIAEVITASPLVVKVMEQGPLAKLRQDSDFTVSVVLSRQIQESHEKQQEILLQAEESGHPFLSGLSSLGVKDGEIHHILADDPSKKLYD